MPWNSKTKTNGAIQRWNRGKRKRQEFPVQKLEDYTFSNEDLSGSNFASTEFRNVIFSHCNLNDSSFRGATLSECIFQGGTLHFTNFRDCSIASCLFVDIELDQSIIDKRTKLPAHLSWMTRLYYKGIEREAQAYLWQNYPKLGDPEDKADYIAMAELEHGATL